MNKKGPYNLKKIIEQKLPPCQKACPALTDIPRYIKLIAEGRYDEAYMINREANMFPSICGRICMHPCESQCNRRIIRGTKEAKESVAIMTLKRFAADYSTIIKERKKEMFRNEIPAGAKKIAIIGAGPAGLTAANDLALMKYDVTVFEKDKAAGGMISSVIPNFRISKELVNLEIDFIKELGVKIKTGIEIGKDITLNGLKEQGYEAIFVAVGMQKGRRIGCENEDAKGVYDAMAYLRVAAGGTPIKGKKILVIGGGNVAMDVARVAVRLDSKEVHVASLEKWDPCDKDHMPASEHEYLSAREEGVRFHFSRAPSRVVVEGGRLNGMELKGVACVYDIKEGIKRFSPAYEDNVKEFIEADIIVTAIGQTIDWGFTADSEGLINEMGRIAADPTTLQTKIPHIFAGGDAVTGPLSIIAAVSTGHRAAISIDKYLKGKDLNENREEDEFTVEGYVSALKLPKSDEHNWESFSRTDQDMLPHSEGVKFFNREIELGFVRETALRETERCMQCNNNWAQIEGCIYCKGCVDVCPQDCLSLNRLVGDAGFSEGKFFSGGAWHEEGDSVIVQDNSICIRCGMCSKRCPVSVICFERFSLRRQAGLMLSLRE